MRAEAQRIKERVAFEREIKMAMQREAKRLKRVVLTTRKKMSRIRMNGGACFKMAGSKNATRPSLPFPRTTQANRLMHAFMPTTGKPEGLAIFWHAKLTRTVLERCQVVCPHSMSRMSLRSMQMSRRCGARSSCQAPPSLWRRSKEWPIAPQPATPPESSTHSAP